MEIHGNLEQYSVDKHLFTATNGGNILRKGWEWTHCIYGLEKLGVLTPAASGLAVGAGREPLIFYFADRISRVTALDLYGNETWATSEGREAALEVMEHPQRWCPVSVDFSRVHFVNGSGTDINFPDGTFDFCWSLSSIEHFGGHSAAAQAMREMARVTKQGGIVAVATEYLMLPEYSHPEYFSRDDLDRHIVRAAPSLELISPIEWDTLPYEYIVDSITVPGGIHRTRRHVVLNDGAVQWTSILLFFRKR
jgi:SAM-dependent methyltransferase